MSKQLVALEKLDKGIYFTVPISEDDCLGTSLPFINFNFRSIDIGLSNIMYSAENYWTPASDFLLNNQSLWNSVLSSYQEIKTEMENVMTTVEQMSCYWFSPITIIHPSSTDTINVSELSSWLNTNYLIDPYSTTPACQEYTEGQQINLFQLELSGINPDADAAVDKIKGLLFEARNEKWVYVRPLSGY